MRGITPPSSHWLDTSAVFSFLEVIPLPAPKAQLRNPAGIRSSRVRDGSPVGYRPPACILRRSRGIDGYGRESRYLVAQFG